VIPEANVPDLDEIDKNRARGLRFVPAKSIEPCWKRR
jgi:hypothetical protein